MSGAVVAAQCDNGSEAMTTEQRFDRIEYLLQSHAELLALQFKNVSTLYETVAGQQKLIEGLQGSVSRLIDANNSNAETIAVLAAKIDRFVDAVFHRGGNGRGDAPSA